MRRVLIIGAGSAIAEHYARLMAARGCDLFMVARSQERLDTIAADLAQRTGGRIVTHVMDVNDLAAHEAMLDCAWSTAGGIDIALIAHGTLPNQVACEGDVALALSEFATNGTSTIALMARLAQRLQAQGSGTLAVISSVAGDRGRASNYLYGSAKAAVSAYASGLRQRLQGSGVNVLTIKPGFVDTPMTRDFRKGLLWASPQKIAAGIVKAIDGGRAVVYLPGFWWLIMAIIKYIPEFVFRRIKL
ncbi:SDR family oxidoreductase [Pseudoxanthomonas wuyuanensis]|uniref:Short-chain dehydrogenase n=1 Tax=Pseudoxanthomonas wuyuanensis TaxID=1073196 RepID=A0A286DAG1_9GAMM|nr:SDR family oxidoreductase [Pseudoxanthomonas wuyuanensis]KAF1720563.1 short-chain dehydrogenase [Pseudoxanthomonas wuyuanensis]SOD55622.1 Short-chain dehydrogenase [Pseudoxanthomonas wuyuanensis]